MPFSQSERVGNQFLKFINKYTPPGNDSTGDRDIKDADDAVDIVQEEVRLLL